MSALEHVTTSEFPEKVLKSSKPVLVDFYTTWCGPCKMLAPVLEELAGEMAETVSIVKVNVEEEQSLAAQFQISAVPTLIVFKDGKVAKQMAGFQPKPALKQALEAVAGSF